MAPVSPPLPTDLRLGPHTIALIGADGGRYPAGNSVLVAGTEASVIIDPSTSIVGRGGAPTPIDHVLLSHAHEDHVAGVHLFPHASVSIHHADQLGIASLDGLMTMYGLGPDADREFREMVLRDFTYSPRADAATFDDGHVIDVGGATITAVHLPGHTRGHTGFLVEPDGVFVTGDIDLSTFGPYYGDAWSDLDAFESSLRRAREIDARWYVTFHHKGVVDGRAAYVELIDAFSAVIGDRERRMVEFMHGAARTLDELAAHRFVYRPHVALPFVESVERRSAAMSLRRLVATGAVREVDPGRFSSAGG